MLSSPNSHLAEAMKAHRYLTLLQRGPHCHYSTLNTSSTTSGE